MVCGAERREQGLNMDVLDHSEDEEERRHCGGGARFGARWQKPRSKSHHQLLLMDSVGNGNGSGVDGDSAPEDQEILPLPDYERLSQSARLPDDPDPKNPLLPEHIPGAPPAAPPPPVPRPQKKPAAWRLIEYVRSRNRSSGCSSDGDSRSSDGEKDGEDGGGEEEKNKKRSSWLPDRERRWPVQGFYGEKEADEGGEEGKKDEKNKKRSSWLPDRERRWPVQGFY